MTAARRGKLPGAAYGIPGVELWYNDKTMSGVDRPICHVVAGHDVPSADVMRRYARSRDNFVEYAALADSLLVFDAVPTTQRTCCRR